MTSVDVIVIGGGPAGLTAAYYLARHGVSVALFDKNATLGGCHRVVRDKPCDLFAEHAPRVYSNSYVNTIAVMQDMDNTVTWDTFFTPYAFSITRIASKGAFGHLDVREIAILGLLFVTSLVPGTRQSLQTMSVQDMVHQFSFSDDAMDYLDRVCRLTDGAPADRYSLWQFLQLINQQMMYGLYQPRQPTDIGLFSWWEDVLTSVGCSVHKDTQVLGVDVDTQTITTTKGMLRYKQCIVALPPVSALQIAGLRKVFPDMTQGWAHATDYIDYISMTFHFRERLPKSLTSNHGFPDTPWAIVYIAVSHYWDDNPQAGVLSVTITRPGAVAPRLGKSAHDISNSHHVVEEVYYQLSEQLQMPDVWSGSMTPGTYHDGQKWVMPDTAWVASAGQHTIPFHSTYPNVFTLGVHNGESWYNFTAMESAVENALHLCRVLGVKTPTPTSAWTVGHIFSAFITLAVLVLLWIMLR